MLVNVLVDGDTVDKNSDEEVKVNYEMGDNVEDIKVKISLMFAGIDPAKIVLFYNNRKLEDSVEFSRLNYEPYSIIYCKKKMSACTCIIF